MSTNTLLVEIQTQGYAKRHAKDLQSYFESFEHLIDFVQANGLSLSVSEQGKAVLLWRLLQPVEEPASLYERLMSNLSLCDRFIEQMERCLRDINKGDIMSLALEQREQLLARSLAVMLRFKSIQDRAKQ